MLVYELVGPMLTKWALTKSGDIQPSAVDVRSRRMNKFQEAVDKQTITPTGLRRARRIIERRKKRAARKAADEQKN